MPMTEFGDISPRTAALSVKNDFLPRAIPYLVFEKFGQVKVLPEKSTRTMKFRRYNALSATPNPLSEGVTPAAKKLTSTVVTTTLQQYGDLITLSDIVMDTHEDPVLQEAQGVLGEQAAQMMENVRFNVLKAGTNQFYANGSVRSAVNTVVTIGLLRNVVRALKRQNARQITSVVRSTPSFQTENVAPAFVAVIHPDLEPDIRGLSQFTPVERYGSLSPWENELGKVEEIRFVTSTLITPWADAGGTKGSMISTSGTSADVYPILVFAKDAYGLTALRGKTAVSPSVVNAKPTDSDPLAQRTHVGYKTMQGCVILQDLWMAVVNVAATA